MPGETTLQVLRALSGVILAGILLTLIQELWKARDTEASTLSADANAEGDDAGED